MFFCVKPQNVVKVTSVKKSLAESRIDKLSLTNQDKLRVFLLMHCSDFILKTASTALCFCDVFNCACGDMYKKKKERKKLGRNANS